MLTLFYIATITPTASGIVTVSVAANVAKDAANNPNTAATAKTVTVSLDTPPPVVFENIAPYLATPAARAHLRNPRCHHEIFTDG